MGSKLQRGFFFGNSHTLNQMPAMRGRGGRGRGEGSGPGRGRGGGGGQHQNAPTHGVDVFKKLKVDVTVTDLQPSVVSY